MGLGTKPAGEGALVVFRTANAASTFAVLTPSNVLLTGSFLVLNCTLNILNKWALGVYGFSFPLLLTTCHMAFCFLALLCPMLREPYRSKHKATMRKQWIGLLTIGVTMAINVALNNLSLVTISLSLNQIIRSAMPICTCIMAICIENKVPSVEEGSSLCILSLGVMIAMWEGSITGNIQGIALCSVATFCNAAASCCTGRVMSEKVDVLRLTFYMAPVSCCILLPFYFCEEHNRFQLYWAGHKVETILVICSTCAVALMYNVIHAALIQKTSAITVTVLGEIKIIGILLLSAWILGEDSILSPRMTAGVGMAVLGFIGYSHVKVNQFQRLADISRAVSSENREKLLV